MEIVHQRITGLSIIREMRKNEIPTPVLILSAKRSVDDYKDMAASTMEECDSLIEMINTMLDITEAEAGVNGNLEEEFNLAAMIIDVCELFRPVAEQKSLSLDCKMPVEIMFSDVKRKMQRIVTNLLENAIQYTPATGSIDVSATVRNGAIQIDFQGTGVGISEAELPHIFERFYRCDRSRTQGGGGLGLSLAKAFAESMQGLIEVHSSPNHGSAFTLKFGQ